jgi:DNA-binding NarL/FixJ family response regulator
MMAKIRVGLFDDHPLASKGLSDFISEQGIEVIFNCTEKENLFREIESGKPEIVILDVLAPGVSGLEIFEEISRSQPHIKVIAYTSLNSIILVENLLSLGVLGFVNKKQEPVDIIECIQTVYNNNIYVPKEYSFLTSRYRVFNNNLLSNREIEILKFIAKEYTSSEIAEKLAISVNTVENHRKNIFRKLEVKNLAGMIVAASRLGYIS